MTFSNTSNLIDTHLRVITWNIWWQFGPWQKRMPLIIDTLRQVDADIIALQEVWDDGTDNCAALIAEALGYHYVYADGLKLGSVTMGNAILSRWPITEHEIAPLSGGPDANENRVAIYAEIDGPRGIVPFTCTHINYLPHHSHIRQKQVGDVARLIAAQPRHKFPPILCGDFNADPGSDEIRMLKGQTTCLVDDLVFHDAWAFVHAEKPGDTWDRANPYTLASFEPNRRLDYIFAGLARGRGAGHIVDCRIVGSAPVDGIYPSDHYGVVAEMRY